jgi:ribonuclease HI
VVANIQALFGESAQYLCQSNYSGKLDELEVLWLDQFKIRSANGVTAISPSTEDWEIRKEKQEFDNWKLERKAYILSFDGASKGNPGLAGGGGIIESPSAEIMMSYALGLGTETNNIAEAMALWQGLHQAKKQGIQELVIVGDSRLVVRAIICRTQTQSAKLNNLLNKIHLLLASFSSYEIFHVLRTLNEKADGGS